MTAHAFATPWTETIAVVQLTYFLCNVQATASKGLHLVISRRHIISIFYFVSEHRFTHYGVFCEVWMWNVNTLPSVNLHYFFSLAFYTVGIIRLISVNKLISIAREKIKCYAPVTKNRTFIYGHAIQWDIRDVHKGPTMVSWMFRGVVQIWCVYLSAGQQHI